MSIEAILMLNILIAVLGDSLVIFEYLERAEKTDKRPYFEFEANGRRWITIFDAKRGYISVFFANPKLPEQSDQIVRESLAERLNKRLSNILIMESVKKIDEVKIP